MTTISQALNGTLALIAVWREIYEQVTKFMDTVQAEGGNGANKKAWVMAAAKHLIIEAGKTGIYGRNIFLISLTLRSRFVIL